MIKIYIILIVIIIILDIRRYHISAFREETNLNYLSVRFNQSINREYEIFKQLELIKGQSRIIGNIYLPIDENINIINSIFIHETGIYILLLRNYTGVIKGSEKDENWIRQISKNKEISFNNPVVENRKNIVELKKVLRLSEKYFGSIIVFNDRAKIKYIDVKPQKAVVLKKKSITKALKFFIGSSAKVLSEEDINNIYDKLKPYSKDY